MKRKAVAEADISASVEVFIHDRGSPETALKD